MLAENMFPFCWEWLIGRNVKILAYCTPKASDETHLELFKSLNLKVVLSSLNSEVKGHEHNSQ